MNAVVKGLYDRLAAIEARATATIGANDLEPLLLDLLQYIQRHPAEEGDFRRAFVDLVAKSPEGVIEILEFCMGTLRWVEVQDAVRAVLDASKDWGVRTAAERVLKSYSDDWETKDIYHYYRSRQS